MTAAAVCGVLFAVCLTVAWRAMVPARPSLRSVLAADRRPHTPAIAVPVSVDGIRAKLGTLGGRALAAVGVDLEPGVRRDLAVLGRSFDQHLADKTLAALAGLTLPIAWWVILATLHVVVPPAMVVVGGGGLAVAGFLLPDLSLRPEAARRRREARVAVSSLLDLVVISLAGGAGVESALDDACTVGCSWAFTAVRNALDGARLRNQSPWDALAELGRELGVDDLVELAATVSLAGTEGSRIRESLVAKAGALRDRDIAEEEARAQSATERMALPTVLLMAGFIVLVGYPAVRAVMTGL